MVAPHSEAGLELQVGPDWLVLAAGREPQELVPGALVALELKAPKMPEAKLLAPEAPELVVLVRPEPGGAVAAEVEAEPGAPELALPGLAALVPEGLEPVALSWAMPGAPVLKAERRRSAGERSALAPLVADTAVQPGAQVVRLGEVEREDQTAKAAEPLAVARRRAPLESAVPLPKRLAVLAAEGQAVERRELALSEAPEE